MAGRREYNRYLCSVVISTVFAVGFRKGLYCDSVINLITMCHLIPARLIFILVFVFAGGVESVAQRLWLEASPMGYQRRALLTGYDKIRYGGGGIVSLTYSGAFSNLVDYTVGAFILGSIEEGSDDLPASAVPRFLRRGSRITTNYVGLCLGGRFWHKPGGKGLYIRGQLMPHLLTSSRGTVVEYDQSQELVWSRVDFSESYHQFNLLVRLGLGYSLPFTKSIAASVALDGYSRVGNVLKTIEDNMAASWGFSLGLSYRWGITD